MKRVITAVLAVILLVNVFYLSACGQTQTAAQTSAVPAEDTPAAGSGSASEDNDMEPSVAASSVTATTGQSPEAAPTPEPTPVFTPPPIPVVTPTPSPEPTPEPTPDVSPLDPGWFDDAVFFGDSISVTLGKHCSKTGALGKALFLCEFSYSIHNAISGQVQIWYQGQQYFPQDVLPLTGASKCFMCLGINDIALYGGIDGTMEYWNQEIDLLQASSPNVVFFIESCTPITAEAEYSEWNNELIDEYNERLKEMCADKGLVYVDIAHCLKNDNNALSYDYTSDYSCHINYEGAAAWAEELRQVKNYSVNPRSLIYETNQ